MFEEIDAIKLLKDFPEYKLKAGDLGTIILKTSPNEYDVEFVDDEGYTIAVLTLPEELLEVVKP